MDRSKQAFPVPLEYSTGGMTLREYAAVAAMQGQLAAQGPEVGEWFESAFPELARISVALADALLARLEESSNG
jgi:hypothetical protein